MTPKSMFLRAALAALITVLLAATADAQQRKRDRDRGECKETLNAAGKAKFRPFTQARESRGEGAAMADAIANWQRDVSAKYGSQWMLWDNAENKTFKCAAARPGKVGSWFVRCTIEARPCGGGPDNPDEGDDFKSCAEYRPHRVTEAQRLMNGCNACGRQIAVDGLCGAQTESCVRTFQGSRFGRSQKLEVNGAPDRKTVAALRDFCNR